MRRHNVRVGTLEQCRAFDTLVYVIDCPVDLRLMVCETRGVTTSTLVVFSKLCSCSVALLEARAQPLDKATP